MKTAPAPEAPARPAPGEPGPGPSGAVPSEPLHGPVEVAEDSLDGLQTAFRALTVEEVVVTLPVKRKRESEKDAGEEADKGEEQGQDLTNDPTFEGAPSASGLHASPSPLTTTLPAAATSTPTTNPPMAEGTGFTGMPPYPAYGMGSPTTALLEATTASEPVAFSSAPRWYAAEYPHPLPATGTYVDVPGYAPAYATLSGLRRGPESLGGRNRGSGRSSDRSLTRSHSKNRGRPHSREPRETGAPDDPAPSVTYHGGNDTPPSTGQPPGGRVDKHPGGPEEPTDADSSTYTEKSFRTENGPAALQPRDELHEGRAGLAGADSLEGNGGRGA